MRCMAKWFCGAPGRRGGGAGLLRSAGSSCLWPVHQEEQGRGCGPADMAAQLANPSSCHPIPHLQYPSFSTFGRQAMHAVGRGSQQPKRLGGVGGGGQQMVQTHASCAASAGGKGVLPCLLPRIADLAAHLPWYAPIAPCCLQWFFTANGDCGTVTGGFGSFPTFGIQAYDWWVAAAAVQHTHCRHCEQQGGSITGLVTAQVALAGWLWGAKPSRLSPGRRVPAPPASGTTRPYICPVHSQDLEL